MIFRNAPTRRLICVFAMSLLTACGGGGGGGGGATGGSNNTGQESSSPTVPITPAANPGATFSPASVSTTLLQGESDTIAVNAVLVNPAEFTGTPYFYVVDSAALLQPKSLQLVEQSDGKTWTAFVTTSSELSIGHYQGNFILQACKDSACSIEYDGFPVLLPYDLTVDSSSNQSPLSRWNGAAEWSMIGGNAAHTSYVPISIDPNAINVRWRWHGAAAAPGTPAPTAGAPVTLNGAAYFLYSSGGHPQTLYAMSEEDESVAWSSTVNWYRAGAPALSSSRLFFSIDPNNGSSMAMWSANVLDGSQAIQTPYGMANSGVATAVVQNNRVYTNDEISLNIFDGATGGFISTMQSQAFSQGTSDGATAFDGSNCYFLTPAQLNAFGTSNGLPAFTIASNTPFINGGDFDTPIVASDGSIIGHDEIYNISPGDFGIQSDAISSYNPSTKTKNWTVATSGLIQSLAAGNGVLYSMEGNTLVERSLIDGSVQWHVQLSGPTNINNPNYGTTGTASLGGNWQMIVTNNLAFASTALGTFAVDLGSRQVVWSYNRGGSMSLSPNGILYVATYADGGLTAFNLR